MGYGKTEAGLDFEAKDESKIAAAVCEAFNISEESELPIIKRSLRWDALFHNKLNLAGKDLARVHPMIGFAFSTIQTYLASTIKTLFPSTPFFPIKANRPDLGWARTANVQQEAMDWNANAFQHLLPLIQTMLHSHLHGTGWARAQWKMMPPKKVTYKKAKRAGGRTISYDTITDWVMDEGLKLRNIPYWMVRKDPTAESIRESRWLIVMEVVSKMRLKHAMNSFPERYNKKFDEIRKRSDYPVGGIGKKMVELVNYSRLYEDSDLCVVMYVYLPFQYRYLELIDGETVIRDVTVEPDEFNIPIKPFINTVESFPTSLQGMSDMAVIEQLGLLQQEVLGSRINSMFQQLDQVWMYDRDVIPDARMLYGGNSRRIGYSSAQMRAAGIQNPKDIITQLQSYPIPADSYNLTDELERHMQNATGSNKVVEGGITEEKRTMFEIKTAVERHDQRQALKMKLLEMTGIEMLATDAYRLMGKYATEAQKRAMLGDAAQYWAWETPFDIPGGVNFQLKGSSLMAGLAAKQEERLELYDRFKGSGFINEKRFVEVIIDNSEGFSPDEAEEIKAVEQPAGPAGAMAPQGGQPMPGGAILPSAMAAA